MIFSSFVYVVYVHNVIIWVSIAHYLVIGKRGDKFLNFVQITVEISNLGLVFCL